MSSRTSPLVGNRHTKNERKIHLRGKSVFDGISTPGVGRGVGDDRVRVNPSSYP